MVRTPGFAQNRNWLRSLKLSLNARSNSSKYLSTFQHIVRSNSRHERSNFGDCGNLAQKTLFELSCGPFKLWTPLPFGLECRTVGTSMECPFKLSSLLVFCLGSPFKRKIGTFELWTPLPPSLELLKEEDVGTEAGERSNLAEKTSCTSRNCSSFCSPF